MKQKKPYHCEGCKYHHKAGHKQGTPLHGSKFDNWCCKYSTAAPRAVSICKIQGGKSSNVQIESTPLAAVGSNAGLGSDAGKGE